MLTLKLLKLLELLCTALMFLIELHEVGHDVHRHREHHSAVVLRGNAVQCLQIPQLRKNSIKLNTRLSALGALAQSLQC